MRRIQSEICKWRERILRREFGEDLEIWKWWNFSAPFRKYYKKFPLVCFIIFFRVLPLPRNFSAPERWVLLFLRKAKRWVDHERPRGYSENGRKWEREEKGLVRSVKKVKRWEGEKVISENLKSTQNKLKEWSKEPSRNVHSLLYPITTSFFFERASTTSTIFFIWLFLNKQSHLSYTNYLVISSLNFF